MASWSQARGVLQWEEEVCIGVGARNWRGGYMWISLSAWGTLGLVTSPSTSCVLCVWGVVSPGSPDRDSPPAQKPLHQSRFALLPSGLLFVSGVLRVGVSPCSLAMLLLSLGVTWNAMGIGLCLLASFSRSWRLLHCLGVEPTVVPQRRQG